MIPLLDRQPSTLGAFHALFPALLLRNSGRVEAAKSRFKRHDVSGDGRLDLHELLLGEARMARDGDLVWRFNTDLTGCLW